MLCSYHSSLYHPPAYNYQLLGRNAAKSPKPAVRRHALMMVKYLSSRRSTKASAGGRWNTCMTCLDLLSAPSFTYITSRRGAVVASWSHLRRRRPSRIGQLQALRLRLANRFVARLLLPLQKFLRDFIVISLVGFSRHHQPKFQRAFIHSSCSLIS